MCGGGGGGSSMYLYVTNVGLDMSNTERPSLAGSFEDGNETKEIREFPNYLSFTIKTLLLCS
jgi:hypothetical protein